MKQRTKALLPTAPTTEDRDRGMSRQAVQEVFQGAFRLNEAVEAPRRGTFSRVVRSVLGQSRGRRSSSHLHESDAESI